MATYLNSKQRVFLIKALVFFSLIRWYNLLLIAAAQYLTAIYILHPHLTPYQILENGWLHWMVLSTSLIIAGGYLINAFYDYEKDIANRGEKVILNHLISKRFAINSYMFFNTMALGIAYFLNFKLFLFYGGLIFLLWFYSHKLKKLPLLGDFCASFLMVSSFLSICIFYWEINMLIVLYVTFLGLLDLIREIIKDLGAIKGDILFGYRTFPVVYGIRRTKILLLPLMLLAAALAGYLFNYQWPDNSAIYFSVSLTGIVVNGIYFMFMKEEKQFKDLNNVFKLLIALGVLNIFWVG